MADLQKIVDALDPSLHSRRQVFGNLRQRQIHDHKELACFVVDGVSNPFDFLFQSLIKKTQRCDCIAITAQGHLIR